MNGSVTLTVASIVAAPNSTISAEGGASIVVTGNISASGATLSITSGNMTVAGSVIFDNSTVLRIAESASGTSLKIEGNLALAGKLVLSLLKLLQQQPGNRKRAVTTQQVDVVTYGSASGFLSGVDVGFVDTPCSRLLSATPNYGPTTLSVTLRIQGCDSNQVSGVTQINGGGSGGGSTTAANSGPSEGAIIGIGKKKKKVFVVFIPNCFLAVGVTLGAGICMIVLLLWLQNRRLKQANERFRQSQAVKAKSEYMVQSTASSRGSTYYGESPVVKKPTAVVNKTDELVAVPIAANPAFGKTLENVEVTAAPATEPAPRLRIAFTRVFQASEIPIDKDKDEIDESESGDSVHDTDCLPLPQVPVPVAVSVHASSNAKGFDEVKQSCCICGGLFDLELASGQKSRTKLQCGECLQAVCSGCCKSMDDGRSLCRPCIVDVKQKDFAKNQ